LEKEHKKYLIAIIVALLIIAGIAFYFYKQGKKTVTIQQLPGQLPGDSTGTNETGASNDEIKLIVEGLYKDMKGFNWLGHNYEPYDQANELNDTDLVKLYNAFNTIYQTDSGQTLTQWISNESYFSGTSPHLLLARFAKLNLQ
jgi:hypothetical protein